MSTERLAIPYLDLPETLIPRFRRLQPHLTAPSDVDGDPICKSVSEQSETDLSPNVREAILCMKAHLGLFGRAFVRCCPQPDQSI
jgi:hypothetical protein